jgi:hypothetical protein
MSGRYDFVVRVYVAQSLAATASISTKTSKGRRAT